MATSNFKHLEYLPLDEDNLVLSGDPESNIKSKSCINLGFIALNSISRLQSIIGINNASATTYDSFLDFTYSIESALATILSLNSISNPQNTEVTEHYKKYQIAISAGKILPSFTYCQNLIYSGFKTWAGLYGTTSYYINLREAYEEYLSVSEVAYWSTIELFKYAQTVTYNGYLSTRDRNYLVSSNLLVDLLTAIEDDSTESDRNIYNFSKFLITGIPIIAEIYSELRFYREWLVEVLQFMSTDKIRLINQPKNNSEAALNTLTRVVQELRELGINSDNLERIDSKFIRQTVSYNIFEMCQRLIQVRKESTFIEIAEQQVGITKQELLVNRFHQVISINRVSVDYILAGNLILTSFAPPGGYAFTLLGLATILLNRAYIVSYRNVKSNEKLANSPNYRRSIKLIGYAGILLVKTGLPHLQSFGINLLKTYRINITNIDPNNLLDIY